jgi:hypothetical protein
VLGQTTGNFGLIRLTTARTRGKPPPSPIYYTMHLSTKATSKWFFVLGLSKGSPETARVGLLQLCATITSRLDLQSGWGLKQTCSSCQELFNSVSHATCTHENRVDSWLFVVGNQTASLTFGLSFCLNLCYRCPNGSCKPILDIYTWITFQWYKALFNARCFDLVIAL